MQAILNNCLFFKNFFHSLSFCFCPRSCNSVAHRLAWASSRVSVEVWEDVALIFVKDALYSDLIQFDA